MGWKHTNAIRDISPPGERPSSYWLVLHVLASYADNLNGTCYPSMATIARNARLTAKSVRRQVQQLKKDGFLRVLQNEKGGKPGNTPLYQLKLSTSPPPYGSPRPPVSGPKHSREMAGTTPSHGSQKGIERSNKGLDNSKTARPPNAIERKAIRELRAKIKTSHYL